MRKREIVFAAIITMVLAVGDIFAFPMGLFFDLHIADIEPMYFSLMINQWFLIIIALVAICLFCPNWQLRLTKENLGAEMKKYGLSGLIIFVISSIAFIVGLHPFDNEPTAIKVIIEGFIYYIGVAFIEELYIRGLLLNIIEKLFPRSRKATLYAVIVSSMIFGIGHIFGVLGSSVLTIISKVVWTIGLGIYLGAIYKKSNNLWVPILLHAVIDFCAWPFCFSTKMPYPKVSLWILLITYIMVGAYGIYIILSKRNMYRCNMVNEEARKNENNCY